MFCTQDKHVESLATKSFVAVVTGTEEMWLCRLPRERSVGHTGKDVANLCKYLINQKLEAQKRYFPHLSSILPTAPPEALVCLTTGMEWSRYLG